MLKVAVEWRGVVWLDFTWPCAIVFSSHPMNEDAGAHSCDGASPCTVSCLVARITVFVGCPTSSASGVASGCGGCIPALYVCRSCVLGVITVLS